MKLSPSPALVLGVLGALPWMLPAAAASVPDAPAAKLYVLRPADLVSVLIAGHKEASQDYVISSEGTIQTVYLKQPVKLAGLSVNDAVAALSQACVDAKVLTQPQITLTIKGYASRRVTVAGQVARPGVIYIMPPKEMTLVEAILETGGPTPLATTLVDIKRILPDGKTSVLHNVDLRGAMENAKKDIPLQEGDAIYLGESALTGPWP